MRRLLIAGALALGARGAAADPIACAEDGAPLYTEATRAFVYGEPPPGGVVRTEELVIYPTGAWRRTTRGPGADRAPRVDVELGCLDPTRQAELRRALGKARFRATTPRITCRAMPQDHVVYASPARGGKVERDEPCREVLDPGTELLAECADVVTAWNQDDDAVRASCRGDDAAPR